MQLWSANTDLAVDVDEDGTADAYAVNDLGWVKSPRAVAHYMAYKKPVKLDFPDPVYSLKAPPSYFYYGAPLGSNDADEFVESLPFGFTTTTSTSTTTTTYFLDKYDKKTGSCNARL